MSPHFFGTFTVSSLEASIDFAIEKGMFSVAAPVFTPVWMMPLPKPKFCTPSQKKAYQTTPHEKHAAVRKFVVTHPFHPLSGQEFDCVERRNGWLDERVFYYEGGCLKSLPASWTNIEKSEEVGIFNNPEAYFRTKDLLELYELIVGIVDGNRYSGEGN